MTKHTKIFQLILIPIILLGLMGPFVPVQKTSARIHQPLLEFVQEYPDQTVSVIVQKLVDDGSVERRVEQLGGLITRDLHIINSFTAELPAGAALQLSRDAGVRWMSLDSPVFQTGNGSLSYYLKSDPSPAEGDVNSQPLLQMNGTIPVATTLFNYDADRDGHPGLTILPGGSDANGGPYLDDPSQFQRWRVTDPANKDIVLQGSVQLDLWSAVADFTTGVPGAFTFYLYDTDGANATLIGSGTLDEVDYQIGTQGFVEKTLKFHNVNYLLASGHYLEMILTVPSYSDDAMWIAYDTAVFPTKLRVPRSDWQNVFTNLIGADSLWAEGLDGTGVTVAVVDSGLNESTGGGGPKDTDFSTDGKGKKTSRVLDNVLFNSNTNSTTDSYGHGTHIAGTIGANGYMSNGEFKGVAPNVNFINIKVSDDEGVGTESDVVSGLQWVYDNKDLYNIKVVNLSLNSSLPQDYHTSPLNAALEILWFNGVVVVVAAGNNGSYDSGILYPPANDPFAITVGAIDDRQTSDTSDDQLASFSAYGTTESGFAKPDLVAPGSNIIAVLSSNGSNLVKGHPDHKIDKDYFRMSGTSMSAAVTSGAVALLLQDEPTLTPDQVKYRLMATANPLAGAEPGSTGAGLLDIYAAVHGTTTESANTGIDASQLLWTGDEPIIWDSVAWNSVAWNSVAWNSVAWNSVAWNSVAWNSVAWNE